jgi:hypothetical protein
LISLTKNNGHTTPLPVKINQKLRGLLSNPLVAIIII